MHTREEVKKDIEVKFFVITEEVGRNLILPAAVKAAVKKKKKLKSLKNNLSDKSVG